MRNQEAARYARWAAVTAAAIALVVAGVYSKRAIQAARARHSAPTSVPATVQQQSAEFKFTKMEQDRAIFTIRASTATRFKDEDRSLLEDVWITIYGRAGDRNDNIHTRECSYEPKSGEVHCAGNVEIDIQGANPASGKPADKQLQVTTSNLSFNRDTGEASTPEKVEFQSPQGHGSAVGVSYSSQTAVVRLEHNVAMEMIPANGNAGKTDKQPSNPNSPLIAGVPVTATSSSLELRRNERIVVLNGPATIKQGARELSAEKISMELDPAFHAQHVTAEGNPVVKSSENGATMNVAAEKFEGFLSPCRMDAAHRCGRQRERKPCRRSGNRPFHGLASGNRNAAGKKSGARNDGEGRRHNGFTPGWRIAFAQNGSPACKIRRRRAAGPAKNRKRGDTCSRHDRDENSRRDNAAPRQKVCHSVWIDAAGSKNS